jgi:hypothetical protein
MVAPVRNILDTTSYKDVFFLLGVSPASEFYMQTFWNTVCSIFIGVVSRNYNWEEIAQVFMQVKV